MSYYAMMDDVINNRTTELTEKRIELFNEAMATLNLMIVNSKVQSEYEIITNRTM